MEVNKPFLKHDLTSVVLSNSLNMKTNVLAEVLKYGLNMNFNSYINKYRVLEVKKMLENTENLNIKIIGIAYDCGFNSKSTFNS